MRKIKTNEEKAASKIADIVSDLRIDLDMVGYYLVTNERRVAFRRLEVIYEAGKAEKDGIKFYDYDTL